MSATISEQLANFIFKLTLKDVPPEVHERAKMRILDFAGVALAGGRIESSRIMVEVVKELGGLPESTIIGSAAKTSCAQAALANGTMAHASDFDDDHRSSTMHPGSAVIPAALALAEKTDCSGRRLIEAVIAGYETACRVGDAFLGTQYHEGFHPTGTCGVFAAAAAAAKVLDLTPAQTVCALGIAGTQAAGLEEWKSDGTWIKRLHPGKAGHSGTLAALLARRGYTGPASVFEGRYGFLNAFSYERTFDIDKILGGLGETFIGHATAFKPYPCCRFLHQVIDGILDLARDSRLVPENIATIKIRTFQVAIDTLMEPAERRYRPQSIVDAQFSIPFVVGAAVVRKQITLAEFTEAAVRDPAILAVAAKVVGEERPEFTAGYPQKFPTAIEIGLQDGTELRIFVEVPSGDPSKPEYRRNPQRFNEDLVAKFMRVVGSLPPYAARAGQVVEVVKQLENRKLSDLMQLLIP